MPFLQSTNKYALYVLIGLLTTKQEKSLRETRRNVSANVIWMLCKMDNNIRFNGSL